MHKAQGSGFDVVVLVMDTAHFPMLRREVLYTAITRAKQRFVYVGSPKAFYMALSNTESVARHTGLFRLSSSSQQPAPVILP